MLNGDTRFTSVTSTTQYTNVPTGSVRMGARLPGEEQHQNYIPLGTMHDNKTNGHVTFKDTDDNVNFTEY